MGDHSRGTHQLPHLWPLILTPYMYISQKPLFLPKNCHPKSCFSTVSKILETVNSKTPNRLEKRYPNALYFYGFCHWKTPIFCLSCKCLRGMLLPQTRSEAGKCCILETESCNLVNTFRCKFNKGVENKISVLQAQPTQLLWKNFTGGQGWYTGHHTLPGQTRKGIYVWFCTVLLVL